MFTAYFHKQFKKDVKNCRKEGRDIEVIKYVISRILEGKSIEKNTGCINYREFIKIGLNVMFSLIGC